MKFFGFFQILLFSFWASGGGAPLNSYRGVQNNLASLNDLNQPRQTCQKSLDTCSPVIRNLQSQDKQDEFLGLLKNQYETCSQHVKDDKNAQVFNSPQDLSKNLAQYYFKGSVPAESSAINRCLAGSVTTSKEAVSKYFYYVGRMQSSQASAIEEIADLDQVIGSKSTLADVACESMVFESSRTRCEELKKSCKPKNDLESEVQQARQDLAEVTEIESASRELEKSAGEFGSKPEDRIRWRTQLRMNKLKIEMIKSRSPVLAGETFNSERDKDLSTAVLHQLQENRKFLQAQIGLVDFNMSCLSGTNFSRSCTAEKVRKFIEDKTKPQAIISDRTRGVNPQQANMGASYMTFQDCLHNSKIDQLKTADILSSSAFNAILTVGTVGLGSYFALGKALQTARQMQIVNTVRAYSAVADTMSFGLALQNAAVSCLSKDKKLQGEESASKSTCKVMTALSGRVAVKAYDDCVVNLATAAMGLLPAASLAALNAVQKSKLTKMEALMLKEGVTKEELAAEKAAIKTGDEPASLKKVVSANAAMDDTARAQKIAKDFKNFSADQVNCVVQQVHPIGKGSGVYQYSKLDIIKKARTLRRTCKIGLEDTEALLRLGYAGELPTDASGAATFKAMLEELQPTRVPGTTNVRKSLQELKEERSLAAAELAIETDPLKRVDLKDKIKAMDRQISTEIMTQNPRLLDEVVAETEQKPAVAVLASEKPQVPVTNPNSITISDKKMEQLASNGTSSMDRVLLEILPGDKTFFKSVSFGEGRLKIIKADPEHPGNILVEILNADPAKNRKVSMPQTEIAMTDAEKAKAAAAEMQAYAKKGPGTLNQMLEEWPTRQHENDGFITQLVRSASRSPALREAEELEDQMERISLRHRGKIIDTAADPEYIQADQRYNALVGVSRDESRTLRALSEIDVNQTRPSQTTKAIIAEAKKIRDAKAEAKLPQTVKNQFRQIKEIEKLLAEAPQRYESEQISALTKLNGSTSFGSRFDTPAKTEFEKSFARADGSLDFAYRDTYDTLTSIFKRAPRNLTDEMEAWLRDGGARFYRNQTNAPKKEDPTRDYFLKRLEIYLNVENNKLNYHN